MLMYLLVDMRGSRKNPRGDIRERSVFGGVGGGVPMLFLVILM